MKSSLAAVKKTKVSCTGRLTSLYILGLRFEPFEPTKCYYLASKKNYASQFAV